MLLEGGAIGQVRRWQVLRTVAGYPTRREAQALLDERLRAVNAGASPPEASIAFGTFVEEQWKALVLPTFKASTQHGYKTTLRAAHKLAEAGIESSTLQRHLSRGDEQARPSDQKRLYVLDESSLASTKQIHTFLERLSLEHCVLLRGDVRQHEAVDAGRPYHQLQEAGIRTAHLDEIVRQRDAELRAVVEELSRGNVQNAVEGLDRQGRVHEIARREERLAAIANEYVKEPHVTLVISPDNQSRQDPNDVIHRAMQHEGHVARDEHGMSVLVPRQEITGADRQWAARYEVDDLVRYSRGSEALGIEVGDYARVERVDAKSNQVIIRTDADGALSYDPRRLQGVTLYRETERAFAAGDRQMTAPDRGRGVPKRSAFQIIPACLLLATRTYCRKASPLDVGRCFTLRSDSVSSSTQTPSAPPAIREATSVLSAFVVGTPLAALAALSIANSFIGHMTPDISIYLLHARTFVETLNRFTLSWDFKGIMVMFVLALPVRVFGATMGAAAFAQLCACVVGFCFLFCVARSYADRWSSTLLVLLATCVIFSNHILGGRVRPENFALACCTGCLYAGLRAKPRWWIAGGAMTAFCLFLKITLVLAPGATMVAAAVADAVDQVSPRSKRWPLFLPTLTRNSLWILLGFATVAGAALAWIAAFDDLAQSYRQTVVYPMQVRAAGGFHLSLFMNPVNLLQQSNLSFLFAGCIPGLLYGWFRGFRRQALLAGVLLLTEVVRVAVEGSPYPYLVTIMVMPMLLGVAFFGSAKTNSTAAMLAWIAPLYLLAPLLIPTVREQVKTFELRVVKGLPAPYEYLAQQMRERYRPSESIFVVGSSEEIVLLLNAPRPFPITYDYLLTPLSEEERRRTLKQYEEQPPDWIIRREPERSPVRFTTLGNVDAAYHVYLPAAISIQSGDSAKHEDTPTRVGSSLAPVGSVSRQYWLEVDTGYLQAWHLLKNGA